MSVTIRKRGRKWYVYVAHHGLGKAKCVGTRLAAEEVQRKLEARLVLGDLGFLGAREEQVQTFDAYARLWLKQYAEVECKPSTVRSYEQLLRVHVSERFGAMRLTEIRRTDIKKYLADLSQATKIVNDLAVPKFSQNTLRLIISALRVVLSAAVEDGLIPTNPASKVGRFAKSSKPAHEAGAMNRKEVERFLSAVDDVCPECVKTKRAALYVRVSTNEQDTGAQERALREYVQRRGWKLQKIYRDHGMSGTSSRRPALSQLLNDCRRGLVDVVVVWKFDRFARSLNALISGLELCRSQGIDFVSVTEAVDTSLPAGELVFQMIGAVAQFERSLIAERVKAGLANARAKGKVLGRPPIRRLTQREIAALRQMRRRQTVPYRDLACKFGISVGTAHRLCS